MKWCNCSRVLYEENGYTVFSFPYCGIDKYDSYFFSVKPAWEWNSNIRRGDVDYIANLL